MASTFVVPTTRHQPLSRHRGKQSGFLVAAGLLIAVIIAEAVVVVLAGANIAGIDLLSIATT